MIANLFTNLEQNLKTMTNKEKFQNLISKEKSNTISRNRDRIKNRARLRESQDIALKVLNKLDDLGWSQRKLAEELKVTPQQVNKIVKGKENLTLETQVKLQQVLDIPILASYYENKKQSITVLHDLLYDYLTPNKNIQNYAGVSLFKKDFKKSFTSKPKINKVIASNYKMAS